jgi:SAM-dependent methyltransferase
MTTTSPTGHAEAVAAVAVLQRMLPPELLPFFDASFIRSYGLYGEFTYRLVLQVARETDLDEALREPGALPEIAARAGLEPGQALVPLDWMLRFLAARGALDEGATAAGRVYRARGPLPVLDPAPVREEQLREAPSWMPAYALAETVARDYPAFLRGRATGEDVLFSARRLRLWIDYFSNDNGLYAINNRVGAVAVEQWMPRAGGVILELGGGLGSGALALLERLDTVGRVEAVTRYHFTEFVPAFLRRGEHALRARHPRLGCLTFGLLDMNRPFREQGVTPGSVSVVFAVNTLHVAHDLEFTLGEVRACLAPGGRLVASECVRPRPYQSIDSEFVFNLAETFRSPRLHALYRPSGGFLTPEQWKAAMEAAGFTEVRFLPDVARIREAIADFMVAAIGATAPA